LIFERYCQGQNQKIAAFGSSMSVVKSVMKISAKLAFFALVSTLAYLALAVVGLGGLAAFFSHPPLVVIAFATLVMAIVSLFSEGNLSSGEREDRANRWVLPVFGVLGLLSGYLPAYTDRIDFWTFGGEGVRWLGALLFIVGGALRMWPVFVLGKRFSGLVAIQPGHRLVTDGIYRTLRNPSYLGLLINGVGWALAFRSGVGLLLVALMLIPLIARIRSEEALLRTQFGSEYEAYCNRTWRLIPGVY
jgi:protein-S-isoprenylcysteine O-methyltransferase Ste14